MHTDEAASWDGWHERFEIKRTDDQEAHGLDGTCTDMAEEYVNRLRFAEIGIHHGAGSCLPRWSESASWREESRCVSNGDPLIRWDCESVARDSPTVLDAVTATLLSAGSSHHPHSHSIVRFDDRTLICNDKSATSTVKCR